jgi:hypothetical protein
MASQATEIKNAITSHLRRTMYGENIYGCFESTGLYDGKNMLTMVIDVFPKSRFEKYGSVIIYHPVFGKWIANLLSEHHCGKPVQAFTTEQIRDEINKGMGHVVGGGVIYKVYGGAPMTEEQARERTERMIREALFGAQV